MGLVFIVWLADISSNLSFLLAILGLFGTAGFATFTAINATEGKPYLLSATWAAFFSMLLLLGAVLPSKQGFYQIAAAYGAVETVEYLQQSDDAKRIAGKSIQAIEKMSDDAVKEDKK